MYPGQIIDRNVHAGTKLASIEVVLHRRYSSTLCLLEKCACFSVVYEFFQEYHQCQIVWIQIRADVSSDLIWVQIFCKGLQKMTQVDKDSSGLQISVCNRKLFCLFLNQNMLWVLKIIVSMINICLDCWVRK